MNEPPDNYVHGHHESVLRSHTWRTVENSAAYLLDHLEPGLSLLDVGCGPATITVDLARRLTPGHVTGIDPSGDVVAKAQELLAAEGATNCTITTGDVYALDFPDDTFDIVHAHQVLQHLREPVAALREMGRVTKPGGIVAVRDADYGAFSWAPADPRLDHWLALYHRITDQNEVEADAGRYLLGWAHAAGLDDATMSSSTWTYATPELRRWWGELWADRVRQSSYASEALTHGLADEDELESIAAAFRAWADHPDATFIVPHGELIIRI